MYNDHDVIGIIPLEPGSKCEALRVGVHLILLSFIRISLLTPKIIFYPPGSKCKALRLGVHLILLYFIRISLLYTKIFVLFSGRWGVGGGGWAVPNFFVL